MQRRGFIRAAAVGSTLLGLPAWLAACVDRLGLSADQPLEVAKAVATWLRTQRIENRGGYTWPRAPDAGSRASLDLYSGTPGIILFLLELHHATGDPTYLDEAGQAAFLLQGAYLEDGGWPRAAGSDDDDPALDDPGLYTGWSGAAFALSEVFHTTGDGLTRTGSLTLFDAVLSSAQTHDGERAWYLRNPDEARYDIVGGSAGMGLALLYAHDRLGFVEVLDGVVEVGRHLLARARLVEDGAAWPMSERAARLVPGFGVGTAGVAYFLARLAEVTGDEEFLDGARAGARYLQAQAACEGEGCLSWHSGAAGAARLYEQLARVTGAGAWRDLVARDAREIQEQWSPTSPPERVVRDVSQCCGDAGLGDFFASLASATGEAHHLDFARRLGAYIVDRSFGDRDMGLYWRGTTSDAETDGLHAQTGWMQGAAGIGGFFLHLDGAMRGRAPRVVFPDSPWTGSSAAG